MSSPKNDSSQKPNLEMALIGIKTIRYFVDEIAANIDQKNKLEVNIGTQFSFSYDDTKKHLISNFICDIHIPDAPENKLIFFETMFTFALHNTGVITENNHFLVPEPALHIAASLSYSTSRGILFDRNRGTKYSDMILPIIMSDKLLEGLHREGEYIVIKKNSIESNQEEVK